MKRMSLNANSILVSTMELALKHSALTNVTAYLDIREKIVKQKLMNVQVEFAEMELASMGLADIHARVCLVTPAGSIVIAFFLPS